MLYYSVLALVWNILSCWLHWVVHVAQMGEKRNTGKARGKEASRKTNRTGLGEAGWGDVDWIGLAQDRNRW
jgi:hypothetical protein